MVPTTCVNERADATILEPKVLYIFKDKLKVLASDAPVKLADGRAAPFRRPPRTILFTGFGWKRKLWEHLLVIRSML